MARRSLHDCRILITGASSGIGLALGRELARHGSRLMLVARREELLREATDELTSLGALSADCFAGDVTDGQVRTALVDQMREDWGQLDLLVNNAGVSAHGYFEENGEEVLRQILEVNFFAATELTRMALPLLRGGKDPMVVNVGSILGHRGIPHNSEYCASKFALRGWSEALRAELKHDGIELLMVSPGTTDSEFFDHLICTHGDSPWGTSKGVSPEEVARQIVRGIQRRRREIFPNWRGRLLVLANRICPGLVDRVMNRYG